jgi:hypothetical protein
MDFEKHGPGDERERGANGGVETLQVTDLCDASGLAGHPNEFVRFTEGSGERLLDENVNAGFQQLAGDAEVMDGGNGD